MNWSWKVLEEPSDAQMTEMKKEFLLMEEQKNKTIKKKMKITPKKRGKKNQEQPKFLLTGTKTKGFELRGSLETCPERIINNPAGGQQKQLQINR